ncbi:MAG: hypothetical protein WBB82_04390 [Limnothrix sp.]
MSSNLFSFKGSSSNPESELTLFKQKKGDRQYVGDRLMHDSN